MCCHVGTLTHVLQHPGGYMGPPKLTRQEPTAYYAIIHRYGTKDQYHGAGIKRVLGYAHFPAAGPAGAKNSRR